VRLGSVFKGFFNTAACTLRRNKKIPSPAAGDTQRLNRDSTSQTYFIAGSRGHGGKGEDKAGVQPLPDPVQITCQCQKAPVKAFCCIGREMHHQTNLIKAVRYVIAKKSAFI